MKALFLFVFLGIGIRIIDAIPLLNYLDYDYDISCNSVKNYYTSAIIVNHSIQNNTVINNTVCHSKNSSKSDYLKKGKQNNSTFHGSVILEYKTLAYCHYICKMNVIANQENINFISKYFDTYFQIGGILHIMCNNTICNWGNLICNGEKIKDEL